MPDLRAGDVGTIRLTAGLDRWLTFEGIAGIIDTGAWTATVDVEELSVDVDGDDVVVRFPGDTATGRFVLASAGIPQVVGLTSISQRGTQDPDGTVSVRLATQTVSVMVIAGSLPDGLITWPEEP